MKLRIRHKDSGQWLFHSFVTDAPKTFICALLPNENFPDRPTEWDDYEAALIAMGSTTFKTANLEIVGMRGEEVIFTNIDVENGHMWGTYKNDTYQSCKNCGLIRNPAISKRQCRPTKIGLRQQMIQTANEADANRDFKTADAMRERLKRMGPP